MILAEVMQIAFYKKENKNINIKVTVRFTTEEKELIDEYIVKNNFKNVTEFIRELIKKEIN